MTKKIEIRNITVGGGSPLAFILGPCVIESEDMIMRTAEELKNITSELGVPFIFKSSYDKANRTSIESFRGPGIEEGLKILEKVRNELTIPILTDVHSVEQCCEAGDVVDVLQIPAFLCRQTDLLVAAAKTNKVVNVKKGQFLNPEAMEHVVKKVSDSGNYNILITERGTSFGYNNLVVDFRSLPKMASFGYPVVFDATHSVQEPGGLGATTGGDRKMARHLARAAVAVGVDMIFMEVHPDPDKSKSDAPNSIALSDAKEIIKELNDLNEFITNH